MTPQAARNLRLAVALLVAALVQFAFAAGIGIRGVRPDLLLATALLSAMFSEANGAAALGFFAGLIHACFAAPALGGFGSLIVSRILVCFGVGWLEERIYRDNGLLAVIVVGLGTLLTEGVYFILAPQRHLVHWARSVGGTTLYNLVLAYPLYLLLRRWLGPLRLRIRESY
jgi:cell shape-determining protein MreD